MSIENVPDDYDSSQPLAPLATEQKTNLLRSLDNSVRAIRAAPVLQARSADLGCIIAILFLSPAIAFFTLILYLTYVVFYIDGAQH